VQQGRHQRVLFVFRHGETDWNREGRLQGHTDTPLNATGLAQAEALALRLRTHRLDAVLSSDLARALTTARIVAETLGVPLATDLGLRETNVGAAEGMIWADAKARFGEELTERWYCDNGRGLPRRRNGPRHLDSRAGSPAAIRRRAPVSTDRCVDPWRNGAPAGQTFAAACQRAGQSTQHGALRSAI
jgi:broad specificity phosphatase PhoE